MNVMLLGATGFLGTATARELAQAGHSVVGVSRHRPMDPVRNVEYLIASYDDADALTDPLERADVILHMAWTTTPSTSAAEAGLELKANLDPLARFLDRLQDRFSGHFVFISTGGALYGNANDAAKSARTPGFAAFSEHEPFRPSSYYGAAKGAAELLLRAHANQTNMELTILRPSNVYGPGQLAKSQFAVVPTLLQSALRGTNFDVRGDGSAERDYLYIGDFVDFIVACLDAEDDRKVAKAINVCSGVSVSVMDLIAYAENVTGARIHARYSAAPSTDVKHVRLSPTAARQLFSWSAQTPIEEGLGKTWDWIRKHA